KPAPPAGGILQPGQGVAISVSGMPSGSLPPVRPFGGHVQDGAKSMDFEKYSERTRGFIQAAQTLAQRSSHQRRTPEHLLKVLLDDKEGLAAGLMRTVGADPARALRLVEQ